MLAHSERKMKQKIREHYLRVLSFSLGISLIILGLILLFT